MINESLIAQCDSFLTWAKQYPLMWQQVEAMYGCIASLTGVPGSTACMQLRNSFQTLSMYANEGGFEAAASIYYGYYVSYCRLLLAYVS
jgi:hypothetical protein